MPTTSFKLPTTVRSMAFDGGSGEWTSENSAKLKDGIPAQCALPDGGSYSPTGTEISAGHVLPIALFMYNYDFSSLPANAVVTGITAKSILYSTYAEAEQNINYYLQLAKIPDAVLFFPEFYYLLAEAKSLTAIKSNTAVQTVGGASDVWQPNPNLTIDGMFMHSTDGSSPSYKVITNDLGDPLAEDYFYNGHDYIIKPQYQGYASASLTGDGYFATFNHVAFLAGGGYVDVAFPDSPFPLTRFVAQAGPVTPGDATFQCVLDVDVSLESLSAQINAHPDTSVFVSSSIFSGAQVWNLQHTDIGVNGNNIAMSSNLPVYFPSGQFSGGTDPDENISVETSVGAYPKINASGGPIAARPEVSGATQTLQITNAFTAFTLKTSLPASYFKDSTFGIAAMYNWQDSGTGDPLLYPPVAFNLQSLDYVEIALTYTIPPPGGGLTLLGVG